MAEHTDGRVRRWPTWVKVLLVVLAVWLAYISVTVVAQALQH